MDFLNEKKPYEYELLNIFMKPETANYILSNVYYQIFYACKIVFLHLTVLSKNMVTKIT